MVAVSVVEDTLRPVVEEIASVVGVLTLSNGVVLPTPCPLVEADLLADVAVVVPAEVDDDMNVLDVVVKVALVDAVDDVALTVDVEEVSKLELEGCGETVVFSSEMATSVVDVFSELQFPRELEADNELVDAADLAKSMTMSIGRSERVNSWAILVAQ